MKGRKRDFANGEDMKNFKRKVRKNKRKLTVLDGLVAFAKAVEKQEKEKALRNYVSLDTIKDMNLEEMMKYNCYYITNTDIMININKRPIKGKKFEYDAIGYDFRQVCESLQVL